MMNKLISTVVLTMVLFGCAEKEPVEAAPTKAPLADSNLFSVQELELLKNTVKLSIATYEESGLQGMQAHVEECYANPTSVVLSCVGADYAGHIIDTEVSARNKFPLEAFFFENRLIARMLSNKDFDGQDLFVFFMAAASIKMKVDEYLEELLVQEVSGAI